MFVILYVIFMILLGVVFLPAKPSDSSLENHTFVQLIQKFLTGSNPSEPNSISSSSLTEKSTESKIGMPIYIINLNRSIDRWLNIENELKAITPVPEYVRIEAVDGQNLVSKSEGMTLDGIKYKNRLTHCTQSELACTLSHLKAIKMAYDAQLPYVLIVEDDAMFGLYKYWRKSIPEICTDLTSVDPEWRMLQLFATGMNYKSKDKEFVEAHMFSGTVAYVINYAGMKTIMEQVYEDHIQTFIIDSSLASTVVADKFLYSLGDRVYTYYRPLIYTFDTDSTIGKQNRRDNANFWSAQILKEYIEDILTKGQ
jgi:GR25 family glycosyltransferase involved in LPS biosynthesis